jgi:hypothetical protein
MNCGTDLYENAAGECVADCGDGWLPNEVTMSCDS